MLRDVPLAPGFPMRQLAEHAMGKSGSDLKELCRSAAMVPVRELVRKANGDVALLARGQEDVRLASFPLGLTHSLTRCNTQGFNLRPLTITDFLDPDGASTTVDSELDHTDTTEPLD
jgi:ATPase family AAA domain-containing protein 1